MPINTLLIYLVSQLDLPTHKPSILIIPKGHCPGDNVKYPDDFRTLEQALSRGITFQAIEAGVMEERRFLFLLEEDLK